ncbi:DUF1684 domain-containing protein [Seonamhaeicola sp.]|uniref:DUF1684 domain-containing protein n=1 Tax=Seonamhaeicola sp. TaxID=1912245 RepID=UPI002601F8A9|nr:DUF1684 domain-containing protein [Seonamhaeicola sp.]
MKNLSLFLLFIVLAACGQKKVPIKGDTEYQREQNAKFKDVTQSPLTEKDRKHFTGLDFFKVDSAYIVTAHFKRTPEETPFKMKTTTDRLPEYVKYGELSFTLKDQDLKLDIYQNLDMIKDEGYEDYLFLPFLDETNGEESYGGGRYIDTRIPEGDTLIINFNEAYNPYCAYNKKYSCPIVPRQNYLRVRIEAGVKAFKKD